MDAIDYYTAEIEKISEEVSPLLCISVSCYAVVSIFRYLSQQS